MCTLRKINGMKKIYFLKHRVLWYGSLRACLIWADAKFKLENTSTNPNPNLDAPTVFPLEHCYFPTTMGCKDKRKAADRSGLGITEAQMQVKMFSSHKYKSHRRVPETVARALDAVL